MSDPKSIEARAGSLLQAFGDDLREAWRGLSRRAAYSAFVVFVLALGVGASTAVWTAVRATLLEPLPYPEGERLVTLWDRHPELGVERSGPTPANVLDWRERNRVFSGLAAYYAGEPRTLAVDGGAEKVAVAQVTADFFDVAATPPRLGRTFTAGEVASGETVAVLSYGAWRSRFGGDPEIVGRDVEIDGVSHRVVGVMPADFALPDRDTELWLPWDFELGFARLGHVPRDYRYLRVLARLAPGVTLEEARRDMDRIAAELAAEHPVNRGWTIRVIPFEEELLGDLRAPLWALAGAVAFVFLIALINAAHLVLGRLAGRGTELAVRSALGASRGRLARLMTLEALLLSAAAGVFGCLLAGGLLRGLVRWVPADLPRLPEAALDAASLVQAAVTALAVTALLGMASRIALYLPGGFGAARHAIGRPGQERRRGVGVLIVTQIAAAFVLLAMAFLTFWSLRQVLAVDPGFETERLLVARVFPDPGKYDSTEARLAYFDELEQRFAALPGVRSVGAATGLPMNAYNNVPSSLYASGEGGMEDGGPEADVFVVTPGYPRTLGMRLVEGRLLDARDTRDGPAVAVVNETFARSLWPRGSAVGRRAVLRLGRDRDVALTVVGVVADARSESLKVRPRPEVFRPHAQVPYVTMNVVLRTDLANPLLLAPAVRREVLAIDPTQPVHSLTTVEALVDATLAPDRLSTWLLAALASLALVLAGAGVYGVMAHAVDARRHEIGVRMALGASRRRVLGDVLRHGALLLAAGVALGGGVSFLATRVLRHLLYGVTPTDPAVLAAAAVVLAVSVLAACGVPALRAASVDPTAALRVDA